MVTGSQSKMELEFGQCIDGGPNVGYRVIVCNEDEVIAFTVYKD